MGRRGDPSIFPGEHLISLRAKRCALSGLEERNGLTGDAGHRLAKDVKGKALKGEGGSRCIDTTGGGIVAKC